MKLPFHIWCMKRIRSGFRDVPRLPDRREHFGVSAHGLGYRVTPSECYNCHSLYIHPVQVKRAWMVLVDAGPAPAPFRANLVPRTWFTISSMDEVKAMIEAGVECKEADANRERETALPSSYSKAS